MSHLALLEEACDALPHTTRSMFGGHGLFAPHGGIFAAVVEDGVILKFAEEKARAELVALGGHPWTYAEKMTMKEWIVIPESLYDEPRALAEWAHRAHRLAPPKKEKASRASGGGPESRKTPKGRSGSPPALRSPSALRPPARSAPKPKAGGGGERPKTMGARTSPGKAGKKPPAKKRAR